MAQKLLIIHGYSDGATSFTGLRDFFASSGTYRPENIFLLNYNSMDDDATFEDFADKLDQDYVSLFNSERIDVACHSTGALVSRAWLRMHYQRQIAQGITSPTSPVEHLLMFAPANFGSDLAKLGESFLGKFRCTFFNSHHESGDFLESGRVVLEGLEPASPYQWDLSADDLHGDGYFNTALGENSVCYPFILAAGKGYDGLQARLIPARCKPGTDGTVRICGTSLNSRKCIVDFCDTIVKPDWLRERKFNLIPFAIFDGFNHGSMVDADKAFSEGPTCAGALALDALKVKTFSDYDAMAQRFAAVCQQTHQGDDYQQFFVHVISDVNGAIPDFYLDFYAVLPSGEVDKDLTAEFDEEFESEFTRHSVDGSCRVLLLNVTNLETYLNKLRAARAKLVFDVTAKAPLRDVCYLPAYAVIFDGATPQTDGGPTFLFPNTTTLVEIILNRVESGEMLQTLNHDLTPVSLPAPCATTSATGRATLLS